MNNSQRQIISMLNAAIHKEHFKIDKGEKINWVELIEEAEAHKVIPLIYSSLDRKNSEDIIDKETLKGLTKKVITSNIAQANHIKNIANVIDVFNNAEIPLIVLKGLVVRYLYPIPDLRTMCDADVIVKEEDLDKASQLLLSIGFLEYPGKEDHGAHKVFYRGQTVVELHWTLINDNFFSGNKEAFESGLWRDAMEVKVGGVKTLSLSLEDLAVHLCAHMAVHLAYSGFGIRQLLDLVLLVEKKGEEVDWKLFIEKIKEGGVYKFSIAIFDICNKLFGMEVPATIKAQGGLSEKYMSLLIEEIMDSGVHGKKDKEKVFASEFAYDQGEGVAEGSASVYKKFMKLLFPPVQEMSDKYSYAKKNTVLTPVAWGHHLIQGIRNKDYSFKSKVNMATSTVRMANKRNDLLKELEL